MHGSADRRSGASGTDGSTRGGGDSDLSENNENGRGLRFLSRSSSSASSCCSNCTFLCTSTYCFTRSARP